MTTKIFPMLPSFNIKRLFSALVLGMPGVLLSQSSAASPPASGSWLDINMLLIFIAIFLLLPIFVLGKTLLLSAQLFLLKKKENKGRNMISVLLPVFFILSSYSLSAQGVETPVVASGVASPIGTTTWILIIVIITEALVIMILGSNTLKFLKSDEPEVLPAADISHEKKGEGWLTKIWTKINSFKPLDEEGGLDTGHDYDGIRELDNITPPWFTLSFGLCILFAIFYMWRYHVSKSAPLQIEEFEIEMAQAKIQQDEYLKTQAKGVDENTVVLLTAAGDITAGQVIFNEKCAVCHKEDGGGMVGPNLTDDYWIHGGAIGSIFKVIKYGVPDKGMISWQEQLSPVQMAQVSSYIKTFHGTNPPGAKEKQGDLYTETAAVADSAATTTNL